MLAPFVFEVRQKKTQKKKKDVEEPKTEREGRGGVEKLKPRRAAGGRVAPILQNVTNFFFRKVYKSVAIQEKQTNKQTNRFYLQEEEEEEEEPFF